MKKFKFRFSAVEKIRITQEKEALKKLADAQKKFYDLVAIKDKYRDEISQSYERKKTIEKRDFNSSEIYLEETFVLGNKYRSLINDFSIEKANKVLRNKMTEFIECRQKKEMIQKIKEKDKENFNIQVTKKEQKEVDDINVMRRKMRELF
ncbi:MAG: hypothetical protein CL678_13480 [Bdellovibrionaceae bacterium]|nr:hypothetical protein [Pseudobdellovibrionaceae bacterium]|tara:strand:- start:788 stop:1237 length:450 start_codon:yes stop_codon:yes gene_type:complete